MSPSPIQPGGPLAQVGEARPFGLLQGRTQEKRRGPYSGTNDENQHQTRLRRVAFDPLVRGDGVLPEVFLGDSSRPGREVLLRDGEDLVDGRNAVAVRPVAAEDDAILAEDFHQPVQPGR